MSQLLYPGRRVLWMDPSDDPSTFHKSGVEHCCDAMQAALTNVCDEHADNAFACPDMLIAYSPAFNEYGVIVHDGGPSMVVIGHCPFCGATLPESRRDAWFEALEAQGIDDPFEDANAIPESYRSAAWWQAEGR